MAQVDDLDDLDDGLPKYTPEEYVEYLRAPQWQLDGAASESAYQADICKKVKDWHDSSEEFFKPEKEVWQKCYDRLEANGKKSLTASAIFDEGVAAAIIPIMKNSMMDEISALYSGQYAPVLKPISPKAASMISLANKFLAVELKLNYWDTLKFKLGVDGWVCDLWIVKIFTDSEQPGPFGEKERIVIDRVDPINCCPDPKARRWDWSLMDFFIVKEEIDIGVCRNRFPDKAAQIDESLAQPDEDQKDQFMTLNLHKKKWQSATERQRIHLKECWLHDERMRFRAYEEDYINEFGKTDSRVQVDENTGYVKGQWERAYPNGRMVVTAADKLVLRDIENPYWHKGLPFEICPMSPHSGKLFTIGKATPILLIERKINDVEQRVHAYMQSETERPMVAEFGALPTNAAWFAIKNNARNMVIINKGYNIFRPPPVETPQFIPGYLARLNGYKDQVMGQSGIMRGEVAEGAQLSAQSVQSMQGQAQSRQNMQAVYISDCMRRIGEKMVWLMRETYREDLHAEVMGPNGAPVTVEWNEKDIGNEFWVEVDLASNQPGGQQQIMQQAIQLKREALVDRQYVLQVSGIDGWEQIDQRMQKAKQEEIVAQAFGRSFGLSIKQAEKQDRGPTEKGAA